MAMAPSLGHGIEESDPLKDPIGVRAAAAITTSCTHPTSKSVEVETTVRGMTAAPLLRAGS